MTSMPIGFVGLGNMGLPMACNLLKAGYAVKAYNRSAARGKAFASQGGVRVTRPSETATSDGVVITMVTDDAALETMTTGPEGFGHVLREGALHIGMSTVSPETSRKLAAWHEARGTQYLAAPVFGRPDAAAAAKLVIPCSGSEAARTRGIPVLRALGVRVQEMGTDPGAANVVKLCGNFLILAATQAIAESLSVAERNGLDRATVIDFFASTVFGCPVYVNYGKRIAERDYAAGGFKLSLAAKDLRLFASLSGAAQLALSQLVNERLAIASNQGQGELDVTAIAAQMPNEAPPRPESDES